MHYQDQGYAVHSTFNHSSLSNLKLYNEALYLATKDYGYKKIARMLSGKYNFKNKPLHYI
ncbi:MAG: hypothetical protein J7L82_01835 [Staphylothermus sp.]|nr:hypothetical protein [Staphylothermus sp.]